MTAITLQNVSKTYRYYNHGMDRLWEAVTGKARYHERTALHMLNLTIDHGEIVGLVGKNGAGKSTLLKLVAGMLVPSTGQVIVNGRLSALLELGTGFHYEMSGRDNVYLSGAVMGLPHEKIYQLYDKVVAFADIGDVMDEPVKRYSSGMIMRLAFAVATCIEPDILIIDETLSVGDGAFARKSFDRVMEYKKHSKTILFCSHSMYQVEAICSRVIWIDQGHLIMQGDSAKVISAYNNFLDKGLATTITVNLQTQQQKQAEIQFADQVSFPQGSARITGATVSADGVTAKVLQVKTGQSNVSIQVCFSSDPTLPSPCVGMTFTGAESRAICSASSCNDGLVLWRDELGNGEVIVSFPAFALLKGNYGVNVYLLCEQGIHLYDQVVNAAELKVKQQGLERGVVTLPRRWVKGIETSAHLIQACDSVGHRPHLG